MSPDMPRDPSKLPDGVRNAFRLAVRRPPLDADIGDEVAFHIDMRVAELVARGVPPEEARAEALRRFGNPSQWSEAMKREDRQRLAVQRRAEWLDDLLLDLLFALRSCARAPLFTALTVITLALGIGANAAIFGVVKSVLLNALPYTDADRLVMVYGHQRDGSRDRMVVSAGLTSDLREQATTLSSVSAFVGQKLQGVYETGAQPLLVSMIRAEPSLFATLGVQAAQGRTFVPEDAAGDTAVSVLLTHGGWQRLLGGAADPIGRRVLVNGIAREVVGVLPAGFTGPIGDVDLYMPLSLRPMLATVVDARMRQNLHVVGRLAAGATIEQATSEVTRIADAASTAYPREAGPLGASAVSLRDAMVGDTRTPLLVLLSSAALVLLITCANVAGALVARAISRRKEFALRVALGAGRGRLLRQLLTESMLLSVAGGALGLLLAVGGLSLLERTAAQMLPEYASFALDRGSILVATAIALLTGVLVGLMPAISAGRADPQRGLREDMSGASESRGTHRLRGILVAAQIALGVSVLSGAALLARSLWQMTAAPMGFESKQLLSASLHVSGQRYRTGAERAQFMVQLEDRLRSMPGVVQAATSSELPTLVTAGNGLRPVDGVAPDAVPTSAKYMDASPHYFVTMGIPLLAGREFNADDAVGRDFAVIISASLERLYWSPGGAVGQRVYLGPAGDDQPVFTVVGVVGDVRNSPAELAPEPTLYLANRQFPWNGPRVLLRTQGDPLALASSLKAAVADIDPTLPVHDIRPLDDVVSDSFAPRRLPVMLMAAFGLLALVLASMGVYAMFAAMAAAREREFAVRMALGSQPSAIAALVLRQGGMWMGLGLLLGVGGVLLVSRVMQSMLYGVSPFDPIGVGAAVLLLAMSGACALIAPVRRATRVSPGSVLR